MKNAIIPIITMLCLLIEIHYLSYYHGINFIKSVTNKMFQDLKEINKDDKNSFDKIINKMPIGIIHRYYILKMVDGVYWILCVALVMLLPDRINTIISIILFMSFFVSEYSCSCLNRSSLVCNSVLWVRVLKSITCILTYCVILLFFTH